MTRSPFQHVVGRRKPALPMEPVVEPAGWYTEDITATDSWRYVLSDSEIEELDAAVASVTELGPDIVEIRRGDFPLPFSVAGLRAFGRSGGMVSASCRCAAYRSSPGPGR